MNIGIIGQSNGDRYALYSDLTPYSGVTSWNGSALVAPTGNGEVALGNALVARFGTPVQMVNSAISASALIERADIFAVGWWSHDTASGAYDNFKTACTAAFGGLELDAVVWIQGEAEAAFNVTFPLVAVTQAEYEDGLDVLFNDQIRADFTNKSTAAQLPILIARLPGIYTASDRAFHDAAITNFAAANAGVWLSPDNTDLPLLEGEAHYTEAGYISHAQRMAAGFTSLLPPIGQSIGRF